MKLVLALVTVALVGCATNDEPISAEERAYRLQAYQAMMAGRPAPQQPIYQPIQMQPRRAPVYVAPTVVQPPIHRNTVCNSFVNGRYITTSCN